MQSKVNYTLVGLFVVILTVFILGIAFWLSFGFQSQKYDTYLAYMDESVAGLTTQADVKFNGVNVGYVSDIRLNKTNPQKVILELKIQPDTPITTSTVAVLTQLGITGLVYIGLTSGEDTTPLKALPGQKYPVIRSKPSFMLRLDIALQNLTNNIKQLSGNVQEVFDEENIKSLKETLRNIDKITTTIAANSKQLDETMKSMQIVFHNSETATKDFPALVKSINNSAEALKLMASNLSKTADTGDRAIKSFSSDVLPEVYSTLRNIQEVSRKLSNLSGDLSEDPSMILRGKKAHKPGPGE